MPGIGSTVALPGRAAPVVPHREGVGFPNYVPGGAHGPVSVPDRIDSPLTYPASQPNKRIPGGAWGPLPKPRVVENETAPFYVGNAFTMWWNRLFGPGGGLTFGRHWFPNRGGLQGFIPVNSATNAWTANRPESEGPAASGIPVSIKRTWPGAYRRTFGVNEQLFDQLPHPAIQSGVTMNEVRRMAQSNMLQPAFPYLTRYNAAASYGQTTRVMQDPLMLNLLDKQSQHDNYPFGSY